MNNLIEALTHFCDKEVCDTCIFRDRHCDSGCIIGNPMLNWYPEESPITQEPGLDDLFPIGDKNMITLNDRTTDELRSFISIDYVLEIIDKHSCVSEDDLWTRLWNIGMANLKDDILDVRGGNKNEH